MTHPIAHCTLAITTGQRPEPFVLTTGDDPGSRPVQVQPLQVTVWSQYPGMYDHYLLQALRLKSPGMRRIRLYCSNRSPTAVRLVAHGGGAVRCLGRRREPILETITWLQEQSHPLRYGYDQPAVTIRECTRFFDHAGNAVARPTYLPALGTFRHAQPVTGAMVVEYSPSFFLYEVEYSTGEGEVSAHAFQAVKLAWLAGNIRDAAIPPVRVIALSDPQAAQLSFPRTFWPEHASASYAFQDTERVQHCIDQNGVPTYQYVESKRETSTERIYSKSDPNNYVDVRRAVAISFERQPVSGEVCAEEGPALGAKEMRMMMRFHKMGTNS